MAECMASRTRRFGRFGVIGVMSAAMMSAASPSSAGIISVTGDFAVFPQATASYIANPYNDPTPAPIHIWSEQIGIMLASPVVLDTDLANPALRYVTGGAGAGEVAFAPGGGPTLAAGTIADVFYAYFDPLNDSAFGSVTFSTPILGIVAHTSRLQFSDFLRVPGAPYPVNPAFNARGWENTEWGQVSADRRTLVFNAVATSPGDQFRIFTAPTPVPESASVIFLCGGIAALLVVFTASRGSSVS